MSEESLRDMELGVSSLESTLGKIGMFLQQEDAMLSQAYRLETRLKRQQEALLYMEANVPAMSGLATQQYSQDKENTTFSHSHMNDTSSKHNNTFSSTKSPVKQQVRRKKKKMPHPLSPLSESEFDSTPSYVLVVMVVM